MFKSFRDFSVNCGIPIATILVSKQENCRMCKKPLLLDPNTHVVVVYDEHRGKYLRSRVTKDCNTSNVHEHYGYLTTNGKKTVWNGLPWKWFLVIFRKYGCGIGPFHFTSAAPLLRYLEIQGEGGRLKRPLLKGSLCRHPWSLRNSKGVSLSALWSSFLGGVKCSLFWGGKMQRTSIGGGCRYNGMVHCLWYGNAQTS